MTEIGSKRKNFEGSKRNNEGFYTQEQIKELVRYALEHNVQLIPELDIPGYNDAAVVAYPFLSRNDTIIEVRTITGVPKNLLCVSKESAYTSVDDVISELSEVFPCKYFYIGGDEALLDKWIENAEAQQLKKKLQTTDDRQLMSYFFERVNKSLVKNGKQPLVWMEPEVPTYPQNSVMFLQWVYTTPKVLERALKDNFKMICSPGEYAYFDYPQTKDDLPNIGWMPTLSLQCVYEFNLALTLTTEQEKQHILRVETTIWGESVEDLSRAFYMTYPRALALSEVGWIQMPQRFWQTLVDRLEGQLNYLWHQGVNHRISIELTN